jgi:hypothetical protein
VQRSSIVIFYVQPDQQTRQWVTCSLVPIGIAGCCYCCQQVLPACAIDHYPVERLADIKHCVFLLRAARKLKQAVGSKSYSGDITAASSQTSANIQATVANTGKPSAARPGTATKAVTARPLTPLAASSASTVTDSRYASRVTSAGTKFTGADTALQASTAASISR